MWFEMIALYAFENTITTGYNNGTKRIKMQNKPEQFTIALTKSLKKYNTSIYTQVDVFKTQTGKPGGSFQTKLET